MGATQTKVEPSTSNETSYSKPCLYIESPLSGSRHTNVEIYLKVRTDNCTLSKHGHCYHLYLDGKKKACIKHGKPIYMKNFRKGYHQICCKLYKGETYCDSQQTVYFTCGDYQQNKGLTGSSASSEDHQQNKGVTGTVSSYKSDEKDKIRGMTGTVGPSDLYEDYPISKGLTGVTGLCAYSPQEYEHQINEGLTGLGDYAMDDNLDIVGVSDLQIVTGKIFDDDNHDEATGPSFIEFFKGQFEETITINGNSCLVKDIIGNNPIIRLPVNSLSEGIINAQGHSYKVSKVAFGKGIFEDVNSPPIIILIAGERILTDTP